jgi:hypothetical protein
VKKVNFVIEFTLLFFFVIYICLHKTTEREREKVRWCSILCIRESRQIVPNETQEKGKKTWGRNKEKIAIAEIQIVFAALEILLFNYNISSKTGRAVEVIYQIKSSTKVLNGR